MPVKSLKLADLTSDIKYGWISQIQYGLALTKIVQTKQNDRESRLVMLAEISRLARD